jgi:DNA processing protein
VSTARERAALVALLQAGRRPWSEYVQAIERAGSAVPVLERELGAAGDQVSLLPEDPSPLIEQADAEIRAWSQERIELLTVLDSGYPPNLRTVHDRPPLVFVSGRLTPQDARSVAVVGARRASARGLAAAAQIAEALSDAGYVVVSGLAAGIDAAAHEAALAAGGRTVAVIGTGLRHSYPPENAGLQQRIAAEAAVVSQFWPGHPATRQTFPRRNAVMSGLALATVVVEASLRSGARMQTRLALAHGRPVFLLRALLNQPWALELAQRPGVYVIHEPGQIAQTIESLDTAGALVE